jgi:hypothetical protein
MSVALLKTKTIVKSCLIIFCFAQFAAACRNGQPGRDAGSVVSSSPQQSVIQSITPSDSLPASKKLPASFESKLIGKWIRSDGDYTIEIFSVSKDGKLDAGYFNPNPIHVDKSEWKISENILFMRVILKDINYPGSTYVLRYNPDNETLAGNYFQAVEKTNYDVIFSRKK